MPWKVYKEDGRFCVFKLNADDTKGEKVACHDTEAEADAQVKALYVNVKETVSFRDVMAISELRGSYPTVPISADVDYAALVAGDANPTFITLPIGKANVTSGNKRHYDEAFLSELQRQTLTLKPIGLMGHLSPSERATAFPEEAVHWVGAVRDGDTLWGKAYVVPGPVRERIARYKASGRSLATSIDAVAEQVWDESLKAYRVNAATFRLNQIDLAPADRAGIPALAEIPLLTSEMSQVPVEELPEEPTMGKLEVINELTADDARLLPPGVRDAILATVPVAPEVAIVQELRETLGADDKTNLTQLVTELRDYRTQQQEQEVTRRITELAADAERGIKLLPVRKIVIEMVNAQGPKSVADAEAIYTRISTSDSIKELLQASVQNTMGPPQRTVVQPQNTGPQYFRYPDTKDKEG